MTGPTHLLVGLATTIAVARTTGIVPAPVMLICMLFGAIGPDIDSDSGSITRPGRIFSRFLPRGAANLLDGFGAIVGGIARKLSGHRGMFHWPIIGIVLIGSGFYCENYFVFWFGVGYLSHILADGFTVHGVPLYGPFSVRNYSFAKVKVGSKTELVIALVLLVSVVGFGWELLPQRTQDGFHNLIDAVKQRNR